MVGLYPIHLACYHRKEANHVCPSSVMGLNQISKSSIERILHKSRFYNVSMAEKKETRLSGRGSILRWVFTVFGGGRRFQIEC